jgi:hypothetical protein
MSTSKASLLQQEIDLKEQIKADLGNQSLWSALDKLREKIGTKSIEEIYGSLAY